MSIHKFQASFGNGATCVVTFDSDKHSNSPSNDYVPAKDWSPKPSGKDYEAFFPAYQAWIHTVYSSIAALIHEDYRAVIQDRRPKSAGWAAWIYHPDGTKECVAKGKDVFPPFA